MPSNWRYLDLGLASVAVLTLAAVLLLAAVQRSGSSSPTCATFAARQLPMALVQHVNSVEARQKVSVDLTVLMRRPVSTGGFEEAFAIFDPRYCGFDGNINGVGQPKWTNDRVEVLRKGHALQEDSNGVCISNTVPTARIVKHVIVMRFSCDRLYANSTWMQSKPVLRPLG